MAEQQFFLVVYDISNDKRRTKLHDRLLDFGTPVQYSVFECLLDEEQAEQMKKAVYRIIRKRVDQVRFYRLCKDCLKKVELTCGKAVLSADPQVIIV